MRNSFVFLGLLGLMVGCGSDRKKPEPPRFEQSEKVSTAPQLSDPSSAPSPIPMTEGQEKPADSTSPELKPQSLETEVSRALAAFQGKSEELKGVKLYGHQWNIKAADITQDGPKTLIKGQISHAIRYTPDDQVYFQLSFEGEEVKSFDIQFSDRNWVALSQIALPLLSSAVSLPFSTDLLKDLSLGLDEILYQDWKDQAKVLILKLAQASRS